MQDLALEEIYIIGEFGRQDHRSSPMRQPLEDSTVNLVPNPSQFGKQSSNSLKKLTATMKQTHSFIIKDTPADLILLKDT